jgi:site-specific DNA recombinase
VGVEYHAVTRQRAGLYLRISLDRTGERLGVDRQRKDCQRKAEQRGWRVVDVYEDNDVSASTGKKRPAYERMLEDIENGVINAVVVWDLDRLTRRPIEVEQFIELADRRGVALASVGGDVDLATDNGRLFARIKGAVARAEVERKSARQRAAHAQRAERGLPWTGGRRAFGYTASGVEIDEVEAGEIQRAAATLLAGGALHAIARDWRDRGVLTTVGGQWRNTEVRRMLANPRYAGLRVYRGEVVGRGSWPAILDEDTHLAIRAVLADPSRQKAGPPRRYLLSGLATCSVCSGPLYGATERGKGPLYRCLSRAHVSRQAEPVDAYVQAALLARLRRRDARGLTRRAAGDGGGAGLADLGRRESEVRARLDGAAEAYAAGEIDRLQLQAATRRLRAQLEEVAAARTAALQSPAVRQLAGAGDVQEVWDGLDLERQRQALAALLTVRVHPPGRGARTFNPATIELAWLR